MDPTQTHENLASDRLRGVAAISSFIGECPRRTAYMIERGLIPFVHEGRAIVSFKSWLVAHYARQRSGGPAAQPQP